jgi:hypothetical protein
MKPSYINSNVRAHCPDCGGAVTTFESKGANGEYGAVIVNGHHTHKDKSYSRIIYQLLRCAGCGRAGLAKIHCDNTVSEGVMESFFPTTIKKASIPSNVPQEIAADFQEAELCASAEAWRSASAMLRSALEKILKANGYMEGNLVKKIDNAAKDGILTESRRKKAHDDIRALGNDVLHDEWREINSDEFETSHHYTQRIFEDFYDDREEVEKILKAKGRLQAEKSQDESQVNV